MPSKTSFFKKGFYACWWLDNVDMHMYAKLIKYHVDQELRAISLTAKSHNDYSDRLLVVQLFIRSCIS